jgi:hypothetical protein
MRKLFFKTAHGLGTEGGSIEGIFSKNHFASMAAYPAEVQRKIADWGLTRVAGNAFICESSKDFWAVKGGKLMKLVGNEVDNGESIPGAPEDKPQAFLANILDDLSFD